MPKVYISSADWMTRNIDHRVEVSCPIYDQDIKQELIDTYAICWDDNTKTRILNKNRDNKYKSNKKEKVRMQFVTYNYLKNKLSN